MRQGAPAIGDNPSMDEQRPGHRRSLRLQTFDYSSPGAYFITIVTHGRAALFGRIVNGEMQLSRVGAVADRCWREIPDHSHNAELGSFVVMPNHIHGILILRATSSVTVGAHDRAPRIGIPARAHHGAPLPAEGRIPQAVPGSLGAIIRQYKSSVTRTVIRSLGGPRRVWQRNYYEHVIRDEADCPCASWRKGVRWSAVPPSHEDRLRRYIEANPMNWDQDEENPIAVNDEFPSRKERIQ
jgi:REP element-mobilizing transposase RayT